MRGLSAMGGKTFMFGTHNISVLYEFQIDISANSWEIKYQNMGIGLLHVKRRTRQKWR